MRAHAASAMLRRAWAGDMSPRDLYDVLRLRVEVFVVEQRASYQELDGRDLCGSTRHYWLSSESITRSAMTGPMPRIPVQPATGEVRNVSSGPSLADVGPCDGPPPGASRGVLACLRLLEEGPGEFRVGRVCTAPAVRGHGLARRLMAAALAEVGDAECVLDAQEYLVGFYRSLGFEPDAEIFSVNGIPHQPMRRPNRRMQRT